VRYVGCFPLPYISTSSLLIAISRQTFN
jgi:hypothetical protein